MRLQANKIYSKYFSSFDQIILTSLEVLESRIVSGVEVLHLDNWNLQTSVQFTKNHCPFIEVQLLFCFKSKNLKLLINVFKDEKRKKFYKIN